MNRTVRDRNDRHPKPVKRIELLEKYPKSRLILTILLIVVGVGALGYSLIAYLTADTGWTTIEAASSELNCSDELIFQYHIGTGELSATAEKKAVSALYTETTAKAYQLFHTSMLFDGVKNLYYINQHPNEEIVVDEVLYKAFSLLEKYGNRMIYLAPIYIQYNNLFGCNDDAETVEFDPYQNEEMAAYFAELSAFARNEHAVQIELLGENRIKLFVSEEYLAYASEEGISDFIDFYWMANAFIVDYIADTMKDNGFVSGSISSYDGFVRNLDDFSSSEYAFNLFNRVGNVVHQAGIMRYNQTMSIVFLRDYPANSLDWQHYYEFQNGVVRTAYIDVTDGFSKSAVHNLVAYAAEHSCAEILMQVIPVYIADFFDAKNLSLLTRQGIYAVYGEEHTIYYNEPDLKLTDLYDQDGVRYQAEYIGGTVS
ncbi:MAG: hypothetical protein K2L86_06580 [Lachnospiraceae bacterium]|nr:hypothetical protein [Lachnospiraceae bacterium]